MKSTSGAHFVALDHVRALAALMVFAWHFTHGSHGFPIPLEFLPPVYLAPLSLFDEGHTGVALFMTLSGYLFAKLLDGKRIIYRAFIWNRILRLAPLLAVVIVVQGIVFRQQGGSGIQYISAMVRGLVYPAFPNGGWSITVELHFYLLLPMLLWLLRKSVALPLVFVAAALLIRAAVYFHHGEVQTTAYWTIFGRIDQFVFGIMAFNFRSFLRGRHLTVAIVVSLFSLYYWFFDRAGGFTQDFGKASANPIWIVMTTVEGVAYAVTIAWYDSSFNFTTSGLSGFLSKLGGLSYSVYLLHFYWVFEIAPLIDKYLVSLSNYYVALFFSVLCYLLSMPIAYLSYRWVEAPFLKLRRPYVRQPPMPLAA